MITPSHLQYTEEPYIKELILPTVNTTEILKIFVKHAESILFCYYTRTYKQQFTRTLLDVMIMFIT